MPFPRPHYKREDEDLLERAYKEFPNNALLSRAIRLFEKGHLRYLLLIELCELLISNGESVRNFAARSSSPVCPCCLQGRTAQASMAEDWSSFDGLSRFIEVPGPSVGDYSDSR